jgi:hypothetical protein
MEKTLKGTIETYSDNRGNIKADDGDWYDFKSKLKFKKGDRVKFDPVYSQETFDLATARAIPARSIAIPALTRARDSSGRWSR